MENSWLAVRIEMAPVMIPALLKKLEESEVLGVEEQDHSCIAYMDSEQWSRLEHWQQIWNEEQASSHWYTVLPQNWNALWEASFQPIDIEGICRVRATFHPPSVSGVPEIIINPEMAFGTGHHATTAMMIRGMNGLDFRQKTVLDYGSGSGILSIFAAMEGASKIDAIDYDIHSYESTIANAQLNGYASINAFHGELELLESNQYDIILANIHRHVLLEQMERLSKMLRPDGLLLLSGILETDYKKILDSMTFNGLNLIDKHHKEDWLCLLSKNQDA